MRSVDPFRALVALVAADPANAYNIEPYLWVLEESPPRACGTCGDLFVPEYGFEGSLDKGRRRLHCSRLCAERIRCARRRARARGVLVLPSGQPGLADPSPHPTADVVPEPLPETDSLVGDRCDPLETGVQLALPLEADGSPVNPHLPEPRSPGPATGPALAPAVTGLPERPAPDPFRALVAQVAADPHNAYNLERYLWVLAGSPTRAGGARGAPVGASNRQVGEQWGSAA